MNDFRKLISGEFSKLNKTKKKPVKSAAQAYKDGKKALDKKHYSNAIKDFELTIRKNYKPAGSHFYLGEAHYFKRSYKKALAYYKESFKRYKKGSYNPKLFLHMAISLDKIGQKKQAKKFYNVLIDKYGSRKEAREAKKYFK